ncbi:hypothetical protein LSTR_LSTR008468 [Laodelphax striatellus]|uniref:Rab-GAP TBC domain-containing protein n=1 Tax=Laodelphax striatellus TaxID=195883 RepID=A0A482XT45_LAOST|nr:hypothetical protein LSTR_LSTR008468 [Laodelphax striatellus]
MKTISPDSDYSDVLPESNITSKRFSDFDGNNGTINKHDHNTSLVSKLNSKETENLIICNADLATSLHSSARSRSTITPGLYLQKVFLNNISEKLKSQSLPTCVQDKSYAELNHSDDCQEELLKCGNSFDNDFHIIDNGELNGTSESWFKTWPERGNDKCLIRPKSDQTCQIRNVTDRLGNSRLEEHNKKNKSCDTTTDSCCHGNDSNAGDSHGSNTLKINGISTADTSNICENSPISKPSLQESSTTKLESFNKPVHLNKVLESVPFGYSPITKQLHIIKKPPESNTENKQQIKSNFKNLENSNDTTAINLDETSRNSNSESNHLSRVATEASSFSSTVSSLSDISPSTNDDSALGSLLGLENDNCSLASIGECSVLSEESTGAKPKKKSLTGFFSRNVFNWKSSGSQCGDDHLGVPNSNGWKLFGRNTSSPSQSSQSINPSESDAGSIATPDSPRSIKSTSSSSRTRCHENIVVSSAALIQLDRPSCLPAKSHDELEKHRNEYQAMVEAARKKELKEVKHRKRQLQAQLRLEELQAQAARTWNQDILPKWDTMHNSRKARELWWQGVPPCVRGRVWKLAIGNELNLTHQLYDICCLRAQDMLKSANDGNCDRSTEDNKESSVQLIQLDISRTFPNLCIFQQGGPYYDMLHCLLGAYVCYRPDVGYVQGMSFLAAVLILNMEVADAFICFANLLNRPCHMAFFSLNQSLMQAYYATYNDLLCENLPQIFMHFKDSSLTPDLYLLDWIYTVFTKAMNLDLACRVWDIFLRDGEEFIFRTALGVLHLCKDTLLEMDFIHGSKYLTKLPEDLPADQLFKSIAVVKMTVGKQTFEDLVAFHSQAIN